MILWIVSYFKIMYQNSYIFIEPINPQKIFLAAKWRLEEDKTIKNKNTSKTLCPGECELPFHEDTDFIKMGTKVMSLKEGKTEKGTEVIWEPEKSDDDNDHQHWTRSRPDEEGYFTLQSKATKDLYLHSTKDGNITNGLKDGPVLIPFPPNTPRCK